MLSQKFPCLDLFVTKTRFVYPKDRSDRRRNVIKANADKPQTNFASTRREWSFKTSHAAMMLCPLLALEFPNSAMAIELPAAMSKGSYYVTLGLFIMTVPGLWSLIKRSTKSKIRRRVYVTPGPAQKDAIPLSERAKQISCYFLNYNYQIKSMTDVIRFVGNVQSSVSQASQLVIYTFFGLGSIALVLSIQFPEIGNWWYGLTLLSPLAGWYYWTNANREEEVTVMLMTSDDEKETEIIVEGNEEELDRFSKELQLQEKGKIYVKGILEQ